MKAETDVARKIREGNLLFKLAKTAPLFVIDGRVYYADGDADAGSNVFKHDGRVSRVKEGPLLEVLERISDHELHGLYTCYQEEFIAQELKDQTVKIDNSCKGQEKLARFVLQEIFPYLRSDNPEGLDKILETRVFDTTQAPLDDPTYDAEIEKYVQNKVHEIEKRKGPQRALPRGNKLDGILLNQRLSPSSRNGSLFSRLMNGYNFALSGDQVFTLASVQRREDLTILGRRYAFVPARTFDELMEEATTEKIRSLSIEALRDKLKDSKEFERLKALRTDADTICRKKSHHEQDFGFEKYPDRLTVYVDVPDYVLRNPHDGQLYNFKGHKLGIDLGDNGRLPTLLKSPHPLSSVSGPFYNGGNLCMGNYGTSYLERMKRGKAFAKYLVDARNVVLRGYKNGTRPYHALNNSNFGDKRISENEVKRRGLPITNVGYQPGTRGLSDGY